ncbi:macrolide export ATP-binding/permease protein MacB [Saccharicrinis fermentans DSM 9555 = JCM 21142]|uniref:Macrolide export ATP-binding/permease protein MacB n=1 Tax=Saccharicrinis fermentans DSM 9555 = JCM 21142 TaxID=869213 RepID=W7YGX7_9BACT|nr:ABC transporter permease [Saccharicrinis fermentans]GAF03651.1 macrolide export ATP-binding/permease protein MacB [Saccharicrinis fermentans DSM 9555 = JCM 21142]
MKFVNLFKIAIAAIKRNKMRSFLTMLGIVIGVGAVITMLAIGQGSNESIKSSIASMGTNLINVMPASRNKGGVQQGRTSSQTLKEKDVAYLKKNSTLLEAVSPGMKGSGQVVYGSNNWPTEISGGNEEYAQIKKYEISTGRFYNSQEIKTAAKVCVLGQTVVENVFGVGVDPIGESIRFDNIPFKVIGTFKEKGNNTFGQDQDDMILAPYSTIMKRITRETHLRDIVISAKDENQIDEASSEIETLLRESHKLKDAEDNDFEIRTQDELISNFGSISEMMLVLLGSISAISLVVGGIGIMNIMYVSVTERTREIGLRLAIGGKGKDILMQFLLEAILLSVLGGLLV